MPRIPLALVPEPDDPRSIQVFANGMIGTDPVRFLVDTGARTCTVPLSAAIRQLPSARRSTSLGAAGVALHGEEVVVPEIRIGDLVATNVEADRTDLGAHRHPAIGMNVLGEHRCSFRLLAGVLDIDVDPPPEAHVHPLETHPLGLPFVNLCFDDVSVRACWDTGASRSAVDVGWAQRHPDRIGIGNELTGHDATGAKLRVWEAELAACSIGGISFAPSPCVVIDLGPLNASIDHPIEIAIGVPLIQQANWWFDFPFQCWAVQGSGTTRDSPHAASMQSRLQRPIIPGVEPPDCPQPPAASHTTGGEHSSVHEAVGAAFGTNAPAAAAIRCAAAVGVMHAVWAAMSARVWLVA